MYGEDPNEFTNYLARIEALNLKDLKKSAAKYFNFDNYMTLILYPDSYK